MSRTRETQLDAWDDIQETLSEKRRRVFSVIKRAGGACLFELSKELKWPINRVSGRVTELCDLNLVCDSGERRVNPDSGKRAIVWKVARPGQMRLL